MAQDFGDVIASAAADDVSMNQRPLRGAGSAGSNAPSTCARPIFWRLPMAFYSMVVRPSVMLPWVGWEPRRSASSRSMKAR